MGLRRCPQGLLELRPTGIPFGGQPFLLAKLLELNHTVALMVGKIKLYPYRWDHGQKQSDRVRSNFKMQKGQSGRILNLNWS